MKNLNELVATAGENHLGTVAILDTPCYPARYYAGYVRGAPDYYPAKNDTRLWHGTVESAVDAAAEILNQS